MKTYRVWFRVTEERYIDVDADCKECARRIAGDAGGEKTHPGSEREWAIFDVRILDEELVP